MKEPNTFLNICFGYWHDASSDFVLFWVDHFRWTFIRVRISFPMNITELDNCTYTLTASSLNFQFRSTWRHGSRYFNMQDVELMGPSLYEYKYSMRCRNSSLWCLGPLSGNWKKKHLGMPSTNILWKRGVRWTICTWSQSIGYVDRNQPTDWYSEAALA